MFSFFKKSKTVVTHDGSFHTDDVFACATLELVYGKIKVIRTRDAEYIATADIVVDVGGEYDPSRNRFDHHQIGGAGVRENGIPYASFGLVWKEYGARVSGSLEIATKIDQMLVQPIDGPDNGVDVCKSVYDNISTYGIHSIISANLPTWKEKNVDIDMQFAKAVTFAKELLAREIKRAHDTLEARVSVEAAYTNAPDKRLIVLDASYPWGEILAAYPEPLYVVSPRDNERGWGIKCVRKGQFSFENRKDLPEAWAGLRDTELAALTGVPDAIFCHRNCFLAAAKSREGALRLAELALNS